MDSTLHLVLIFSCIYLTCLSSQQETRFIYNGFDQADLFTDGLAKILPGGILQLTNTTERQVGHAFFKQSFDFAPSEFFTHFVCALVHPKLGADGGHGIAFVVSPSMNLSNGSPTQYLGAFSIATNGTSSPHLLAIELDTVSTIEFDVLNKPHVGISVNNPLSVESALPSYFSIALGSSVSINLLSGEPIQVWVDYDGSLLNVSLFKGNARPELFSRSIALCLLSASTKAFLGQLTINQSILGWSFSRSKELFQALDLSKLPQAPLPQDEPEKAPLPRDKLSPLLIGLVVVLVILVLIVLGGLYLYRRNKYAEVRESWEREYGPHRFSYKSLYKATNGFGRDGLIGRVGFGEVYKGTLSLSRHIAVKRLSHDAEQGMKQFVAEVVTMGSLQHRNLVPLLGYCRRKGELLLVSEYMPCGSLDQHLFHNRNPSLSWLPRISILNDIASAISYLHTGASPAVLHRDIKASNVMLDSEAAVGTIGYMAPELITMGTSTKTDVYAIGAFILEVTCGRRHVEPELPVEKQYLVKWVCERWRSGSLLETRDPRLGGEFLPEEVEMVLKLGLLCTNAAPESRPAMGQVVQYLNQSVPLPDFSPYSPGIGAFMPVSMLASFNIGVPNSRNL
ncbi:hypothetical protein DY000_02020985 [Brassica cretica]|uniref:Protein kinase domain-containing protein n=1 Tax=Brassica cretica TaxID=69181 RepID=A0ABQ7ENQ6_BRACR|nr:hypothetical protein DY000_02020985 [Brassica cretica]